MIGPRGRFGIEGKRRRKEGLGGMVHVVEELRILHHVILCPRHRR